VWQCCCDAIRGRKLLPQPLSADPLNDCRTRFSSSLFHRRTRVNIPDLSWSAISPVWPGLDHCLQQTRCTVSILPVSCCLCIAPDKGRLTIEQLRTQWPDSMGESLLGKCTGTSTQSTLSMNSYSLRYSLPPRSSRWCGRRHRLTSS
jgi:hypothetical protein